MDVKRTRGFYTIVRFVPDILREEFFNVGVILVCPELGYQDMMFTSLKDHPLGRRAGGGHGHFLRSGLSALQQAIRSPHTVKILGGEHPTNGRESVDPSLLAQLGSRSVNNLRFSETRTTVVQEPKAALQALFRHFVTTREPGRSLRPDSRTAIKMEAHALFKQTSLFEHGLEEDKVLDIRTRPVVDFAYTTDVMTCFQAISFAVREDDATKAVNAYRMIRRDINDEWHKYVRPMEARLVAITSEPVSPLAKELIEVMKTDDIEPVGVGDLPGFLAQFRQDLGSLDASAPSSSRSRNVN